MKNTIHLPVLTLGIFAFLVNGDSRAVAPLLIDIAENFHMSLDRTAIFVFAYMICFGGATLLFGPLGDYFGRVRVILVAAFGTSIFSLISAVVPSYDWLVLARAFNGGMAAGVLPVGLALVGEHSADGAARQNAIGRVMGLMFLGGATAMAIGGALAYLGSWRLVYGAYGVAELALSCLLVRQLSGIPASASTDVLRGLKAALTHGRLLQTVSAMFLVGFAVIGGFVFTGVVVQHVTGFNVLGVGLVLSTFGVGALVGGRFAALLRRRLGRGFYVCVAALGGVAVGMLSIAQSIVVVSTALFLFGLAFVVWQSTMVLAVQSLLPRWRGLAMSLASFAMSTGGGLGAWVDGRILACRSLEAIYVLAACVFLTAGVIGERVIPIQLAPAGGK